jgi:hypothetical protein
MERKPKVPAGESRDMLFSAQHLLHVQVAASDGKEFRFFHLSDQP